MPAYDAPETSYSESDDLVPQNYDEIEAVIDLVWGDHPELTTKGALRAAANEKLKEMRSHDDT